MMSPLFSHQEGSNISGGGGAVAQDTAVEDNHAISVALN